MFYYMYIYITFFVYIYMFKIRLCLYIYIYIFVLYICYLQGGLTELPRRKSYREKVIKHMIPSLLALFGDDLPSERELEWESLPEFEECESYVEVVVETAVWCGDMPIIRWLNRGNLWDPLSPHDSKIAIISCLTADRLLKLFGSFQMKLGEFLNKK